MPDFGWKQLAAEVTEAHGTGGGATFVFSGLSTSWFGERMKVEVVGENFQAHKGKELTRKQVRQFMWRMKQEGLLGGTPESSSPTTVIWTAYDEAAGSSLVGLGAIKRVPKVIEEAA